MTDNTFKPFGKCQYSGQCFLYNGNALTPDVEKEMCGRGQDINKDYKPYVPEPKNFTPTEDFEFENVHGICDAFHFYENFKLISGLRKHVNSMQKALKEKGHL